MVGGGEGRLVYYKERMVNAVRALYSLQTITPFSEDHVAIEHLSDRRWFMFHTSKLRPRPQSTSRAVFTQSFIRGDRDPWGWKWMVYVSSKDKRLRDETVRSCRRREVRSRGK